MNVRECPYVVETAQMCQTLIREVSTALTWADMKTAIDAINTVRRRSDSMIAEWHHLNPDENACNGKPNKGLCPKNRLRECMEAEEPKESAP